MRQIALAKLLFINVVIDIDGLPSHISSKLLDELAQNGNKNIRFRDDRGWRHNILDYRFLTSIALEPVLLLSAGARIKLR